MVGTVLGIQHQQIGRVSILMELTLPVGAAGPRVGGVREMKLER